MVNIIIIMGKYRIHLSKWKNQKPFLNCFKNELKNYVSGPVPDRWLMYGLLKNEDNIS